MGIKISILFIMIVLENITEVIKLNYTIPKTEKAVQLIGPDELTLNTSKKVCMPGPYQVLAMVEAVGLCFSDLKLLKQFGGHARKSKIISGIDKTILDELSSYAPDEMPTVPGHEACVRVVSVGENVKSCEIGKRYLVQTDYRWLKTENSNSAFGYNIEGGLQEYVILDERIFTTPDGDSFMIPASEDKSASAVALVEPWACVENAYASAERTSLSEGGKMLVLVDCDFDEKHFTAFISRFGRPSTITIISGKPIELNYVNIKIECINEMPDGQFDDVIYYGSNPDKAEMLFDKVANKGLINFVQCGEKFGRKVKSAVGRCHYGGIRIIGTDGSDPSESMETIPGNGEIRNGEKVDVVGAGGPMGVMHAIRCLCQGVEDITVYAGDLDDERLGSLNKLAEPIAKEMDINYVPYNPTKGESAEGTTYAAIMAPVPQLVAAAVEKSESHAIINIFAGIPATVYGDINLDRYIEKNMYFIGTSGSVLDDMLAVLKKVEGGTLDTNVSVAAICGLEGAVEGIRAVEKQEIAGKIIVYPGVEMGLTTLDELGEVLPEVAKKLNNGVWTIEAEKTLLGK